MNSELVFKNIFKKLREEGKYSSPRGLKIIECENFSYSLPPYVRFCSFESRKLNVEYIKKEFLWYLKGDRFDTSITKSASMWKQLVNDDGSINSNYGQYIFKDGHFDRVANILRNDKDSRRAAFVILSNEHLKSETKDYPCTYSINFHIRENKLNMIVRMRSQDGIYGMGNDAPCFSFIHEMMFAELKDVYKDLEYGVYYHSADSFHVYEKHFDLLEKLENDTYNIVECPKITGKDEVDFLRKGIFEEIPVRFQFTHWLLSSVQELNTMI